MKTEKKSRAPGDPFSPAVCGNPAKKRNEQKRVDDVQENIDRSKSGRTIPDPKGVEPETPHQRGTVSREEMVVIDKKGCVPKEGGLGSLEPLVVFQSREIVQVIGVVKKQPENKYGEAYQNEAEQKSAL